MQAAVTVSLTTPPPLANTIKPQQQHQQHQLLLTCRGAGAVGTSRAVNAGPHSSASFVLTSTTLDAGHLTTHTGNHTMPHSPYSGHRKCNYGWERRDVGTGCHHLEKPCEHSRASIVDVIAGPGSGDSSVVRAPDS